MKRGYEEGHHDEALALWRAPAEKGDRSAQNNISVLYARGEGVAQDKSAAIGWFRVAAEQGFSIAQHNLGLMIAHGEGTRRNKKGAAKWLRKAAEQGLPQAEGILGMLHLMGDGVAENASEGIRWLIEAANQNEAKAQYSLGLIYELGHGGDVNLTDALSGKPPQLTAIRAPKQSPTNFVLATQRLHSPRSSICPSRSCNEHPPISAVANFGRRLNSHISRCGLSSVEFLRNGFTDGIARILDAVGLPADRLELEITETVLLERTTNNLDVLNTLEVLGIRISLDDFGTHYSSLAYLKNLPFDTIKIDKYFIKDIETNRRCKTIVQFTLELAHGLGTRMSPKALRMLARPLGSIGRNAIDCRDIY